MSEYVSLLHLETKLFPEVGKGRMLHQDPGNCRKSVLSAGPVSPLVLKREGIATATSQEQSASRVLLRAIN